jgi:arylsulfatase A-like enzyme
VRTLAASLAAALAAAVLAVVAATAPTPAIVTPDRPNIVLIVTDDQPFDTLPSDPPAMPWLQAQLEDPSGHWLNFTNAVVSTPLCCPSRATILTGQYARQTGVENNNLGYLLDESNTLPVWLQRAGYRTGLVGKYLNEYPWNRGPYVPPGWDRWLAKTNDSEATTYYRYGLVDQGTFRRVGDNPGDYVTDVLGREALEFVRTSPPGTPWFLVFSPPAPHRPWIPAPRHRTALDAPSLPPPSEEVLNDVEGKPAWVAAEAPVDAARLEELQRDRVTQRSTLLAVDEWVEGLVASVAARGELDRTVFVLISDNGYAFGQHRWDRKHCHYEECIRVPMVAYSPWASGGDVGELVSNVDLAATFAELAGVEPGLPQDGTSLAPIFRGSSSISRQGVLIDWNGTDTEVPPWVGVRTADAVYVRHSDGHEELYDLSSDPSQLHNLADSADATSLQSRLDVLLDVLLSRAAPAS